MARNPNRIPIILAQLEALWLRQPDLRLGQLILNATDAPDFSDEPDIGLRIARTHAAHFADGYNIEDEQLIQRISAYINERSDEDDCE